MRDPDRLLLQSGAGMDEANGPDWPGKRESSLRITGPYLFRRIGRFVKTGTTITPIPLGR